MAARVKAMFALFGGFRLALPSGTRVTVSARKAQALLAYLAVARRRCSRDELAALLWGDRADEQARQSLRQTLAVLRRTAGDALESCIVADDRSIALDPGGIDLDVEHFERALDVGTPETLRQASDLYTGDFLQGFVLDEPAFEAWLRTERDRLRERAIAALGRLLDHQVEAGNVSGAIDTALRRLALDPLQEAVHRTLIELYHGQGRRGAALRQYRACVETLRRELGVAPQPETQLLRRLIEQPSGDAARPPEVRQMAARAPARRTPLWPRPSRRLPLVGRADVLDILLKHFGEARQGHGRVVVVAGEAGVGKTRLLQELSQHAPRRRARVLLGGCHDMTQSLPFGPWIEALRTGGVIGDVDLLAGLGGGWRRQLARLFPELEDTPHEPRTSTDDASQLLHAVVELLVHVAARRPLVVLLEDVHWADETTLRLVPLLARRLASLRVLLVITLRDDEPATSPLLGRALANLDREAHVEQIRLTPLSRQNAAALIELGFGETRAATSQDIDQIWEVSDGNPFVILESVGVLLEMPVAGTTPRLPRRVYDLLAARLERLEEQERSLLSTAAIIGRQFDFSLLLKAAAADPGDATAGLEELVRRRLLKVVDSRFAFAHERLREAVQAQLLPPRRAVLHAAVGRAIEACYGRDLSRYYTDLAVHFSAGEVWDKALTYCRLAGVQAMERAAHREAVSWFKQTLDVLARLPETREMLETAIDVRLMLSAERQLIGERQSFESHEIAAEIARRLHDERRETRVLNFLSYKLMTHGELGRAERVGRQALALAERLGDVELVAAGALVVGHALKGQGRFREALRHFRGNIEPLTDERLAIRFGGGRPAIMSRAHAAWCLAELGEFIEGRRLGLEALRASERLDHHACMVTAHWATGLLYTRQGMLDKAVTILETGLELSRQFDLLDHYFRSIASVLGTAYALLGRVDEALALLDRAIEGYLERNEVPRFAWISEALVLARRPDEARARAEQALAVYQDIGDRCYEGWALRLLGEIEVAAGNADVAAAEDHLHAALALADTLELRPLAARCRLDLGLLHQRAGGGGRARGELDCASAEFRALGMPYWLARAEQARALLA